MTTQTQIPQKAISFREIVADIIAPSLKERRNLLERERDTDALTGLANRAAYLKATASIEGDENISFIVFDLNNFGRVNKEISHSFGDELLTIIAGELARAARYNRARAFRLGGDEFVVLAPEKRAGFLRDQIERRVGCFDFDSFKVSISGEIGATFAEADSRLQKRKQERKAL